MNDTVPIKLVPGKLYVSFADCWATDHSSYVPAGIASVHIERMMPWMFIETLPHDEDTIRYKIIYGNQILYLWLDSTYIDDFVREFNESWAKEHS